MSTTTANDLQFHAVSFNEIEGLRALPALEPYLISDNKAEAYSTLPGADPGFPIFSYVKIDGNIASYMRTIPDEVSVCGTKRTWAWTGDNFTIPAFRKRGLSTALQRWATTYLHDRDIGRGSVFSTDVTLHTFDKLGFTLVGYAPRYLLLRSLRPYIEAKFDRPWLRRAANGVVLPAVAAAMFGFRALHRMRSSRTLCEEIAPTDGRLEQLLDGLADTSEIHFDMSAATLRTKLDIAQGSGDCRLWLISDRGATRSHAYLITRERMQVKPLAEKYRNFRLMTVMDFGFEANDADAASAVAAHLMDIFFNSNCEVLELVSTNQRLNRAVALRGMLQVGRGMSFNYSVPATWNWPSDLARVEKWPLTNFRGDAFAF